MEKEIAAKFAQGTYAGVIEGTDMMARGLMYRTSNRITAPYNPEDRGETLEIMRLTRATKDLAAINGITAARNMAARRYDVLAFLPGSGAILDMAPAPDLK